MKNAHKLLTEMKYDVGSVDKGYTNRTLYINLSENKIESKPVTEEVKEKFIGGRGFGLYYLWNAVNENTKWNDPENEVIISSGPIGGITQYPGTGKSLVVSLSPLTGVPIDSNVGGYFGPYLKFSGWDALELQGKAEKDVIIYIDGDNGRISIEEAPLEETDSHLIAEHLTEMYSDSDYGKRNISVVSAGKGAENSHVGLLNFSFWDLKRKALRIKQAGRGGIGTVFRDKKVKAIVVKYSNTKGDSNKPADRNKVVELGIKLHKEIHDLDDKQNRMRKTGTAYLTEIMNDYDLLPTNNFKFGSHPDAHKISSKEFSKWFQLSGSDGCWFGCTLACCKVVPDFEVLTGPYKGQKVVVDGPEYETVAAVGSNCGIFDSQYVLESNFYCDTYGVDTISVGNITGFCMDCYEEGILDKEKTGGLELTFGNKDAALELLHQMARGEGFGKIAGLGVRKLKALFVKEYGADAEFLDDIGMENKGLEYSMYMPKESLAQQGGYALTNKGPQHDEAWLIFMDMVNNQIPTFEDKAEALFYFPIFRTWFGLVGLCKLPWNDVVPADNHTRENAQNVPEHQENYVQMFTAITGRKMENADLINQSAPVYHFQRVFNFRMGYGSRENDSAPTRSIGPATLEEYLSREERYDKQLKEIVGIDPTEMKAEDKFQAMRKFRRDQYNQLCDSVYARRGWTKNAVPTLETLKQWGIDFTEVVDVVKKHL
ncbi:MAG: aldehyde:ferredoxin oxidoreductase [Desulfitibacter sp. BRH_c19]|nr:MAG: aldehyde:ferredoxin oxidoreductase [Desulfitibacter sp. BRH_c19]